MTLHAIEFLRPWWLLVLLLVPWLVWALVRSPGGQGGWGGLVDPALQPFVLVDADSRSGRRWLAAIVALGCTALAIALAGPSWRDQITMLSRGGDPLVIALDLSRSMDVADLKPSRLERAKIKLFDLLERRAGQETALVVYSANAFTVVPLTDDADTIAALVNSLSTDIMPSRGSYPAAAIAKAGELLAQAGHSNGAVLLIADGGYSVAAATAAERLVTDGYTLSVLGVGTRDGGPVPARDGGFETDREGRVAVVGLGEKDLRRLASAGGGDYVRLRVDDADLARVLAPPGGGGTGTTEQSVEVRADDGIWFVLALLPLTLLAFRRGWVFALLPFAILPLASPAAAFELDDLWQTPEQRAHAALVDGDYAAAAALSANPERRAVAQYRAGDFGASAATLADETSARSLYNLGNALARGGDLAAAIDAYDQALELEPGHEDAIHNRDIVAAALEQARDQSESSSGEQQEQEGGESGEQSESAGSDGGADQRQSDTGDSQSQGQSGDAEPAETDAGQAGGEPAEERAVEDLQEAMRAEREAAAERGEPAEPLETLAAMTPEERRQLELEQSMEQWLRRIADDPGGLLRRKFQRQYRLQGRDQDGHSLWPDNEDEPW